MSFIPFLDESEARVDNEAVVRARGMVSEMEIDEISIDFTMNFTIYHFSFSGGEKSCCWFH